MTTRFVASTAGALAALAFAASLGGAHAQTPASKPQPASAASAPLSPLTEPTTAYIVKKGDTLWGLGDKYFIRRPTYEEVRVRNGVRYVRRMKIGLELVIPTRLLKTEPIDGVLGAFRGSVTITGAGAPQVGMIIREGAVIATGADSFARLDLPDGSRVSVPSQSRVRLEILHKVVISGAIERTFAVESGRSESTVAPITRPQDNYFVRTPVSVSAVRGTDFRVAYEDGDKAASTGVVEGKVGLDAPGSGSVEVPAHFGVGVKAGAPLTVVPLLPAPTVTDAGRLQEAPAVTFDIDEVPGAKAYRVQLAADAGMQEIFAEQTHAEPHFAFTGMGNGDYFLRVTAIDPSDIEGLPKVYAFQRDLNTISPTGVTSDGAKGDRRFLFKWEVAGEGSRTYRFQLSRAPSAEAPFVDEGGVKDTQVTVTNLPPGEYRWRVMSATVRPAGLVEKWTPAQTFTVPAN
jgi:hypothetical protein